MVSDCAFALVATEIATAAGYGTFCLRCVGGLVRYRSVVLQYRVPGATTFAQAAVLYLHSVTAFALAGAHRNDQPSSPTIIVRLQDYP